MCVFPCDVCSMWCVFPCVACIELICLCPHACYTRILWWTRRAGQLRAALQLYQQAAGVKPEEEGKQEGTRCAETVAEASLRLAFLCNDLLQVGFAQPDNMQSTDSIL